MLHKRGMWKALMKNMVILIRLYYSRYICHQSPPFVATNVTAWAITNAHGALGWCVQGLATQLNKIIVVWLTSNY